MVKIMTENEWYSSKEHFNTEMDYDEYKKSCLNKFDSVTKKFVSDMESLYKI